MTPREILAYYSREDIQAELLRMAKDREVAGVFRNGSFGQRPNTLIYPQDIVAQARTGSIEFHCSLEHWKNPLLLKENYEELRTGFDIIFDIDCKDFEYGKVAAAVFLKAIEKHGIKNYSVKFSGGKGFHIGIPWGSIPKEINYKPAEKLYPDVPRIVVEYLKNLVRDELAKELLKKWKPEEIAEKAGIKTGDIVTDRGLSPYKAVDIDPVLISPRHLLRMPYSLNKSTFLVSLPLKKSEIEEFRKEDARPEKIKTKEKFLDSFDENEAELLIAEAMDWKARRKEKTVIEKRIKTITKAIPLDFAPPCIKLMLNGLSDGKKRAVFILLNYLSSLKWERADIENLIVEWNKKNIPPLKENYLRGQISYHFHRPKTMPPPNCLAKGYYQDIGVCKPDEICMNRGTEIAIKNPVNYPFRVMGKSRKGYGNKTSM